MKRTLRRKKSKPNNERDFKQLKINNRDLGTEFQTDEETATRTQLVGAALTGAEIEQDLPPLCVVCAGVCECVISSGNGGLLLLLTGPTSPPAYLPSAEGRAQQVARPDVRRTLFCFLPACLPACPNYATPSLCMCVPLVLRPFSCLRPC